MDMPTGASRDDIIINVKAKYDFQKLEVKLKDLDKQAKALGVNINQNAQFAFPSKFVPSASGKGYQYQQFLQNSLTGGVTQRNFDILPTLNKKTGGIDATVKGIKDVEMSAKALKKAMAELHPVAETTGNDFLKIARKAAMVAPIWMVIRGSIQLVTNTIGDGIQRIIDLDKALAEMKIQTSDATTFDKYAESIQNFMNSFSKETGTSINDISAAYRAFSETGLSVGESLDGMVVAIKGSIGTLTDSGELARSLVQLYHNFGDTVDKAVPPNQKMAYMMGVLNVVFKDNAGTMKDYMGTLQNFGSVAKAWGLNFVQTIALVGNLHNAMQKAGRAGTQLGAAFQELTQNRKSVEFFLSQKGIDFSQLSYYQQLISVIRELKQAEAGSTGVTTATNALFGRRGQKAVLGLAMGDNLDKLLANIEKITGMTPIQILDFAEQDYETKMNTITKQLDRMKQIAGSLAEELVKGFALGLLDKRGDAASKLKTLNNVLTNLEPLLKALGSVITIGTSAWLGWLLVLNPVALAVTSNVLALTALLTSFNKLKDAGYFDADFTPKDAMKQFMVGGIAGVVSGYINAPTKDGADAKKSKSLVDEYAELQEKTKKQVEIEKATEEEALKVKKEALFTLEQKVVNTEKLKALGYTEIEILQEQLRLYTEAGELDKQRTTELQIQRKTIEEINKGAESLKSTLATGLVDIFKGDSSWSEFSDSLTGSVRDSILEASTSSMLDTIFEGTGLGQAFGEQMFGLTSMFKKPKGIYDSLVLGGERAAKSIYNKMVQGGDKAGDKVKGKMEEADTGGGGGGGGQKYNDISFGDVVQAGLVGYSAYKNAGGGGRGVFAGALGGIGSIAATQPGMIGFAGQAMMFISMLFAKKQTQSQTTIEKELKEIATKIQISNKELSVVNRNLIAIRQEKTFILPESAYFSTASNIGDNFALHSSRGLA